MDTRKLVEIDIREKIPEIARKGWILSKRGADTGVGYTFEDELGIPENNRRTPDFLFQGNRVELKTQRKLTRALVTLFTLEPEKGTLNDRRMILAYGYKDGKGRPGLCVEINATSVNRQGLRLQIDDAENKLYILHARDGKLWLWDIGNLKLKIERLLFVICDSKNENGCEYFRCVKAHYLTGFEEGALFELLQKGLVVINLRMHLEPDGSVRNRGTAFRGKFKDFKNCYSDQENLIRSPQSELS